MSVGIVSNRKYTQDSLLSLDYFTSQINAVFLAVFDILCFWEVESWCFLVKNLALLLHVGNKALLFNFIFKRKGMRNMVGRAQGMTRVQQAEPKASAGSEQEAWNVSRCPVWLLEEAAAPGAVRLRHALCKWWVVHHYSGEQDKWEINWTSNHCFWLPM